jgi:hypothetical protein
MVKIEIKKLARRAPFNGLFPINPKIQEAIAEDMEEHGFDESKPIDVWQEEMVVLDGHTRLAAAEEKGFETVFIHCHSFPNEGLALEYAIHNQRDRRNFTDADIMRCVEVLDKRETAGRPKKELGSTQPNKKGAKGSTHSMVNSSGEVKTATKTASVGGGLKMNGKAGEFEMECKYWKDQADGFHGNPVCSECGRRVDIAEISEKVDGYICEVCATYVPVAPGAGVVPRGGGQELEAVHTCAVCGGTMSSEEYEAKGCIFCGADSEEEQ